MNELNFNEWMLHIYKQLKYPEEKLKKYEQNIRRKAGIQSNQRWSNQARDCANSRRYVGSTVAKDD